MMVLERSEPPKCCLEEIRSTEDFLREELEVVFPLRGVLGMTVDVPDVLDALFLEASVNFPADANHLILFLRGRPGKA
jgi:hypothetical protein